MFYFQKKLTSVININDISEEELYLRREEIVTKFHAVVSCKSKRKRGWSVMVCCKSNIAFTFNVKSFDPIAMHELVRQRPRLIDVLRLLFVEFDG